MFAIPAGLIIVRRADALHARRDGPVGARAGASDGSTIILAIVGIWVLTVLSRPITRFKVLVIGAMFVALVAVFTFPLTTAFFQLVDPGEDAAVLITIVTALTIGAIEIVRFFHRRFVAKALAAAP